jgi:cytochrome c biogenesis protein CcmG/thiol:disulfide interchange protein DsbE
MVAIAAAAIAALAVFGLASSSGNKGRIAPALPREQLAGARVTLASLLAGTGGRPAAVVFWASWCGPCEKEAPAVERFAASAAGRGRIVGVDWSDARGEAVRFITRYRWTFPVLRDAEGTVGDAYRITNLPTTFVIDSRGRIAAELHGPQDVESLTRALGSA